MIFKIGILCLLWPIIGAIAVYGSVTVRIVKMLFKWNEIPFEELSRMMTDVLYGSAGLLNRVSQAYRVGDEDTKKKFLLESNVKAVLMWPSTLSKAPEVLADIEERFDMEVTTYLRQKNGS